MELIELVEKYPEQLELLFAHEITEFSEAVRLYSGGPIWETEGANTFTLPNYLKDFTACFKAAESKSILTHVSFKRFSQASPFIPDELLYNSDTKFLDLKIQQVSHRPEWDETPCISLIACVLAVHLKIFL